MKFKVLFNGFRHSHIYGLYKKALKSDIFEIAGCIEENSPARTAAYEALGISFSDKDYDWWLSSNIDVVAIGGAYGDRGDAIIKALSAGKHIIADKPICTDLKQLEIITTLCKEKNCKIIGMLDLRYLPQSILAAEIIQSGRLGAVRNVSFNGQHCLNYGVRPDWYFEKGFHGGTINDLAIHGVDLVRMITSLEFSSIDAARTWNAYADKEPNFRDCALFMARLDNNAGVLADVSYSAPNTQFNLPSYWEFRFWCDRGMLSFNYNDAVVTIVENGCPAPEFVKCVDSGRDYIGDLYSEIKKDTTVQTENILRSTLTTLKIQLCADREGSL